MPPHPARELVERLLADGLKVRAIVSAFAAAGVSIHRRTVARIRDGDVQRSESLLAPGEVHLAKSELCPGCRQLIEIKPCRLCKSRAYIADRRDLDQRIRRRQAEGEGSQGPRSPRRRRRP